MKKVGKEGCRFGSERSGEGILQECIHSLCSAFCFQNCFWQKPKEKYEPDVQGNSFFIREKNSALSARRFWPLHFRKVMLKIPFEGGFSFSRAQDVPAREDEQQLGGTEGCRGHGQLSDFSSIASSPPSATNLRTPLLSHPLQGRWCWQLLHTLMDNQGPCVPTPQPGAPCAHTAQGDSTNHLSAARDLPPLPCHKRKVPGKEPVCSSQRGAQSPRRGGTEDRGVGRGKIYIYIIYICIPSAPKCCLLMEAAADKGAGAVVLLYPILGWGHPTGTDPWDPKPLQRSIAGNGQLKWELIRTGREQGRASREL